MDLRWLEDFLVLADVRSFSRTADMRHMTQSALSRRIQSLESWAGVELVDRGTHPLRLTAIGELFLGRAKDVVSRVAELRGLAQGDDILLQERLHFAVPHSLLLSFFPGWLSQLEAKLGLLRTRLTVGNVNDVVISLVEGKCDLVVCYHHERQPVRLDPDRYDMIRIGTERLLPYVAPDAYGQPLYRLPGHLNTPLPLLAYSSNAYFSRITEMALDAAPSKTWLFRRFETDMAEGLKVMALAGHGIAFLPESAACQEVAQGTLVVAAMTPALWQIEMEVLLYRDRMNTSPLAGRIWQILSE